MVKNGKNKVKKKMKENKVKNEMKNKALVDRFEMNNLVMKN